MMRRIAMLLVAIIGCAGNRPLSTPRRFDDDRELRAFLRQAGRQRPEREVRVSTISEAEGSYRSRHAEARVTPHATVHSSASTASAASTLVAQEHLWVTLERGIARRALGGGALEAFDLPLGTERVSENGLIDLDGPVAMLGNTCGGVDLAKVPFDGQPLRICGALIGYPQLFRVGDQALFYGTFDAIGDADVSSNPEDPPFGPTPELRMPTVAPRGRSKQTLTQLGPVYDSPDWSPDVVLRVVLRCNLSLTQCTSDAFVSTRSSIEALWVDEAKVALGFGSTVFQLPRNEPLKCSRVEGSMLAFEGRADGRLATARTTEPSRHPRSNATPRLGALDLDGHMAPDSVLPSFGANKGSWTWLLTGEQFVYGPSRTMGLGGAERPQLIRAKVTGGEIEAQHITPSVDVVAATPHELIAVGANRDGVGIVLRHPLSGSGTWSESPYRDKWSFERSGIDRPDLAKFHTIAKRLVTLMPLQDSKYVGRFVVKVLELTERGLTNLGDVAVAPDLRVSTRSSAVDIEWVASTTVGERLFLRIGGELLELALEADSVSVVSRTTL